MFCGIIESKAAILASKTKGGVRTVRIKMPHGWKFKLGVSVSIDGICSTIARQKSDSFEVEYIPETLSKTTASSFSKGVSVNLERSLKYGQPIDGHLLQGHVDCAVLVSEIVEKGSSREVTIKPNAKLARGAVLHGSIAINGVSLTVAKKHGRSITVALIPHTLKHTNLVNLKKGAMVNVEFDHYRAYLDKPGKK